MLLNHQKTKILTNAGASGAEQGKSDVSLELPLTKRGEEELYVYLIQGADDQYGLHVKDEILRKLEQSRVCSDKHLDFLRELIQRKDLDGDLRGYAMQHLRSEYKKATPEQRSTIRETFTLGL